MLLQALYEFAKNTRAAHGENLHDTPEYSSRFVPWLIQITSDGEFTGFLPLMTKDEPGQFFPKLPRTIEPKDSGTIAEFLVEDATAILGIGESPAKPMKDKARQKHEHFWSRIEMAAADLDHSGLKSVLRWRERFATGKANGNPVFESYVKPGSRSGPKEQWVALTSTNERLPIHFRPNSSIDATFSVDGQVLIHDTAILKWWSDWFQRWLEAREEACLKARGGARICAASGNLDTPISNSHLPKIRGRVIQSFGATLASSESDAVHSYGLSTQHAEIPGTKKGPDASYTNVSVRAAISYCISLNYLLESEDHHIDLGPVSVCTWSKNSAKAAGQFGRYLNKAYPEEVAKFLKAPFSGDVDRKIMHSDRLYTIALTGNAGRVVIQHWLSQTLDQATMHFEQWWSDLQITPVFSESAIATKSAKAKTVEVTARPPSPFAIPNLARATLRESKKQKQDKLVTERIIQLYRSALEGTSPSLTLIRPILDEFQSSFIKHDESDIQFWLKQRSRFALIKLILLRHYRNQSQRKESDFMPEPQLADTPEPAYNLGRLLAVFESLQDRYHNFEKKGAGVVERFYGTASSAPAAVFPQLCRLARHHMSKVRKEDESAARRIDNQIGEILKKFQPDAPGESPKFKRILTLPEQGIFALGFYQQRAKDQASASVHSNLAKACELRDGNKPFDEPLAKARDLANEYGYEDLIASVNNFIPQ
jgi:CRISPR-associated protein Csd1